MAYSQGYYQTRRGALFGGPCSGGSGGTRAHTYRVHTASIFPGGQPHEHNATPPPRGTRMRHDRARAREKQSEVLAGAAATQTLQGIGRGACQFLAAGTHPKKTQMTPPERRYSAQDIGAAEATCRSFAVDWGGGGNPLFFAWHDLFYLPGE